MLEFKAEVLEMRDYVDKRVSPEPHSRIYKLKIPKGIDFQYKAGQFCQLSMDDFPLRGNPDLLKWSSYSIASAPFQAGYLEFSIRLLDTPGFTHHLKDCCNVGSIINIRGPFGVFTMIPNPKRLMFVCTGTGVAPLISHIRALLNDGSIIPISLFFGFKNPDVYIFKDELEELAKKYPNFKLEPTITDAGREDWNSRVAIFHDFFPAYPFEHPEETDVFICGNPKMVEDVKTILPQVGFKPEMMHIEPW
ncbi:MAG: FAD-dependent oxidoreductase [Candidatus Micrarchaeota archaeon]